MFDSTMYTFSADIGYPIPTSKVGKNADEESIDNYIRRNIKADYYTFDILSVDDDVIDIGLHITDSVKISNAYDRLDGRIDSYELDDMSAEEIIEAYVDIEYGCGYGCWVYDIESTPDWLDRK